MTDRRSRQFLRAARTTVRRLRRPTLPLSGWEDGVSAPVMELLEEDDLLAFNRLLPWQAFTVDSRGRRLGASAWSGKRDEPQLIPDRRVLMMDERFGLMGRSVLEAGCFEGVHTIALCRAGADVIAVDARPANLVKTLTRCALYDVWPRVLPCDLDGPSLPKFIEADLAHHVGVLYHLRHPVEHLLALGSRIRDGMMIDTHVAVPEQATEKVTIAGQRFRVHRYREHGLGDAFSGVHAEATWLLVEDLVSVLQETGFGRVEVAETREERNGHRVLVFAER